MTEMKKTQIEGKHENGQKKRKRRQVVRIASGKKYNTLKCPKT